MLPVLTVALGVAACGDSPPPVTPCPKCAEPPATTPPQTTPSPQAAATPEEAKKFMEQVDKDLRKLWTARDRAGWVNLNFITEDTEALGAAGEEATAAYVTSAIQKARRFDNVKGIDPVTQRQLMLLKLAQVIPAPSNADEGAELEQLQTSMTAM